jgi:hypothetical protein
MAEEDPKDHEQIVLRKDGHASVRSPFDPIHIDKDGVDQFGTVHGPGRNRRPSTPPLEWGDPHLDFIHLFGVTFVTLVHEKLGPGETEEDYMICLGLWVCPMMVRIPAEDGTSESTVIAANAMAPISLEVVKRVARKIEASVGMDPGEFKFRVDAWKWVSFLERGGVPVEIDMDGLVPQGGVN